MAWLTNWNYRKAVTISNSGSSLTDYQVLITIDTASLVTAGKLLSSCDDIRFTSSDGSTVLNYWIESGCNTSTTNVWVKVPSIANGSNTIYFYYGYSSATAVSSGPNTFVLFDNFENYTTGNLVGQGGWTFDVGNTNSYKVVSSPVHSGSKGMGITTTIDGDSVYKNLSSAQNALEIIFWCRVDTSARNLIFVLRESTNVRINIRSDNNLSSGQFSYYTSGPTRISTGITPTLTSWYKWKIILRSNNTADYYIYNSSETQLYSTTNQAIQSNMTTGIDNIWINAGNPTTTQYLDDIRIRKYISPEPTFSSLGTEETESLPANITATNMVITPSETPCRAGICTLSVDVTWTNTGGTSGTFVPNITIDTVAIDPPPYSSESLGAGASVTKSFTVTNLSAGNPAICPYPN